MLLLAGSGDLRAQIIFQQPPDFPPNNFNFFTSATGAGGPGFRTFDSFTLSETTAITGITFQGLYYDFINLTNNPVQPNSNAFQIGFFASNPNGLPGALLQTETIPFSAVQTDFVANAVIFDGNNSSVRILSFTADLTTPFVADAGTRFFVSPFSLQTNFNPILGLTSGSGGDGTSVQQNLGNGAFTVQQRDRAFALLAVPEPSTCIMLGLGLVGLFGCARRLRR